MRRIRFSLLMAGLMTLMSMAVTDPARSEIYIWKDSEGVTTFSDDPKGAPNNVGVEVWSERSHMQAVSDSDFAEGVSEETMEGLPRNVTQGEFAIQLARELGLGESLGPEEAAQILSDIRIAPTLGNWELNEALTPDLTSRLRTLTVAAAQMQWITIKPEQALLGFDTAAALLGVDIPVVTDRQASESSQPVVDVPPLVYVSPPPPLISSYYTWVPVSNGFLWHGTTVHGFFALHGVHLNAHFFNGHHFVFEPHFARRHLVNHFVGHTAEPIHHVVRHRRDHHVRDHHTNQHTIRHHREGSKRNSHSRRLHLPGTHIREHSLSHQRSEIGHLLRSFSPESTSTPRKPSPPSSLHARPDHHVNSLSSRSSSQKHIARSKHRNTRGGHMKQISRHGLGHAISAGHGHGR